MKIITVGDNEKCHICGGNEFAISATLIQCRKCFCVWGRCNGRWTEDRSECLESKEQP